MLGLVCVRLPYGRTPTPESLSLAGEVVSHAVWRAVSTYQHIKLFNKHSARWRAADGCLWLPVLLTETQEQIGADLWVVVGKDSCLWT